MFPTVQGQRMSDVVPTPELQVRHTEGMHYSVRIKFCITTVFSPGYVAGEKVYKTTQILKCEDFLFPDYDKAMGFAHSFQNAAEALYVEVTDDDGKEMYKWDKTLNTIPYTLCVHCDHFVDDNQHLENGEQEFNHFASPGETHTLAEWKVLRPDLFKMHTDGKIGPNSRYHSQRGKTSE